MIVTTNDWHKGEGVGGKEGKKKTMNHETSHSFKFLDDRSTTSLASQRRDIGGMRTRDRDKKGKEIGGLREAE